METKDLGTKLDEDLHSRDIFLYGKKTMQALLKMRVVILGMRGLGIETAKNIILTGPKEVAIYDPEIVKINDLGSNFYLSEEDVGKKRRDEAVLQKLKDLNHDVKVDIFSIKKDTNDPDYIKEFCKEITAYDVVVVTELQPMSFMIELDNACRAPKDEEKKPEEKVDQEKKEEEKKEEGKKDEKKIEIPQNLFKESKTKLIYAMCLGLAGFIFTDFGPFHKVLDEKEDEPETYQIKSIEKSKYGLVTIDNIQDTHNLKIGDGDFVIFKDVEGMNEINYKGGSDKIFPVYFKDFQSFYIGDTTNFSDYTKGGTVSEVRMPKPKCYYDLSQRASYILDQYHPLKSFDGEKSGRNQLLYMALCGVHDFYINNKFTLPELNNMEQVKKIVENVKKMYDQAKANKIMVYENIQEFDEKIVSNVARWASAHIPPICGFFGGIVAQEITKVTGKFTPIDQWLICDFFEAAEKLDEKIDRTLKKCRYDDQIAIFGNEILEKMQKSNLFMVGAGATGCEFLKNFAMMGLCTDKSSKFTVTDNDHIEISNLSRQFLFNRNNVGKSKSKIAVESVQKMNPNFIGEAYQLKLDKETEDTFTEDFWIKQNIIIYAVDSVNARKYIDGKVVLYQKLAIDSGTKGTNAQSLIMIPHKTLTYADVAPDQQPITLPQCTLRHFPSLIEHCVEWSKDMFIGYFNKLILDVKTFFTNYEEFKSKVLREGGPLLQLEKLNILKSHIDMITKKDLKIACEYAIKCYTENFDHKIKLLLHCYPPDSLDKDGKPFWIGSKKLPKPIEFDSKKDLCIDYVSKLIFIMNHALGSVFTKEEISREKIKEICSTIQPPPYLKKDEKIDLGDGEDTKKEQEKCVEIKKKEDLAAQENAKKEIEKIYKELDLIKRDQYDSNKIDQEIFEKDHDENGHIDFITAGANLRAENYGIEQCDRNKTKQLAGNIIPTILTTTAAVAGITALQVYTMFQTDDPKYFRNSIINLKTDDFFFSSPMAPRPSQDVERNEFGNPQKVIPEGWNPWDKIEVKGPKTIRELKNFFKEKYNITLESIFIGLTTVYDEYLKCGLEDIDVKIEEAYQKAAHITLKETTNYLLLMIEGTVPEAKIGDKEFKNVSASTPKVKYIFK